MRLIGVLVLVSGLAACSDPLAGVDRLSDIDVAETGPVAAALPDAEEVAREGFLGTSAATGDVAAGVSAPEETTAKPKKGLFAGLLGRSSAAEASEAEGGVTLAALPADDAGLQTDAAAPKPDRKARPRTGPDTLDVPFGTTLTFGQIARVCGAKGKPLGKKIEQLGRRGFALHDSNADTMAKRTFYITGFADNCPRQFTAANALFGPPSFYEQLRYGPAGGNLPYAATDAAYDALKSAVCRVRKSKPCGSKIDRMDKDTAFVSAYEFNEYNGQWKEFLIHDGEVLAAAVKKVK